MLNIIRKVSDVLQSCRRNHPDRENESRKRASKLLEKIMHSDVCTESIFDYLSIPELINCQKVSKALQLKAKSFYKRHLENEAANLPISLGTLMSYQKEKSKIADKSYQLLFIFAVTSAAALFILPKRKHQCPLEEGGSFPYTLDDIWGYITVGMIVAGFIWLFMWNLAKEKKALLLHSRKEQLSAAKVTRKLIEMDPIRIKWLVSCSEFAIIQLEKSNKALDQVIANIRLSQENPAPLAITSPSLERSQINLNSSSSSSSSSSFWSWNLNLYADQNLTERDSQKTIRSAIKNFQAARTCLLKWLNNKNIIQHTDRAHRNIVNLFLGVNIAYTPDDKVELCVMTTETQKVNQPEVVLKSLVHLKKIFLQNYQVLSQKEREYLHLLAS